MATFAVQGTQDTLQYIATYTKCMARRVIWITMAAISHERWQHQIKKFSNLRVKSLCLHWPSYTQHTPVIFFSILWQSVNKETDREGMVEEES